jgi:hypothetical protein
MVGTHVLSALTALAQLLTYIDASSFVVGLLTLLAVLIMYTFTIVYG